MQAHPFSFDSFVAAKPGVDVLRRDGGSLPLSTPAYWFVVRSDRLLVTRSDSVVAVPLARDVSELGLQASHAHLLGASDGYPCLAAAAQPDSPVPAGWRFERLRGLFGSISDCFFAAAGRALQLIEWDETHRFCGRCGAATIHKRGERARECPSCGLLSYPRIAPAAIVAVVRGERLLLARAHRFPPGFYSVLAGYAEPGETLEECAQREVREETGIEISDLRYFASQSWPFPHSLMVAFTARYASGEIAIDPSEITDAGWYGAQELPSIPDRITVARRLIDWFLSTVGTQG
jgi:NAD+ diphosphatase